ncbi:MAG: 3'-5' exonuclease [Candidatus Yanofskybacteria bacterium]|nr:3'-5' exonuclease [Candidatus Yanofskybacteria bacterium]
MADVSFCPASFSLAYFMIDISFLKRPLAITDLEMTGLDVDTHEIIEIGLVVVNQETLEIQDELDIKVRPEHIQTADPEALVVNGYREEDWRDAISQKEGFERYIEKTNGAVFSAWNIAWDWNFLMRALKQQGLKHTMDYHLIDLPSIAWAKLRGKGLEQMRLSALCRYFGIPEEPKEHRAINGARTAYEVLKKLLTYEG